MLLASSIPSMMLFSFRSCLLMVWLLGLSLFLLFVIIVLHSPDLFLIIC
uniref:Uncharacterized protein n=1 Tax=Rhizophora mucronata TaxID=61149 RepID=A0A2P2L3P9_RHIMU